MIETIETEHLTWFNTGNQMNVRHIVNAPNTVNAANSALFGIGNVTPRQRISVRRVKFSACYLLTWQERGDSNNNTTSWYNRESMTTIIFVHIQSITKNIWVEVGHLSMISDCTPTPCAWSFMVSKLRSSRLINHDFLIHCVTVQFP